MTTLELKKDLLHTIAEINDESVLSAIKTFIETTSESKIYKLTPEQRNEIQEGREQIARGEYFTSEQVESEVDKWLKEK